MAKTFKWPEWVPIPNRVGVGQFYNDDGSPCCAIGHAEACGIELSGSQNEEFRDAYKRVAASLCCGFTLFTPVTVINDSVCKNDSERRLLYLASLAYLGYTEGMPERAVRLAEKAKKRAEGGN